MTSTHMVEPSSEVALDSARQVARAKHLRQDESARTAKHSAEQHLEEDHWMKWLGSGFLSLSPMPIKYFRSIQEWPYLA